MAVSATGSYLYVADTWNCRIRAVDLRAGARYGSLYTVAGSGTPGFADGSRGTAEFNLPRGVDASLDGKTLYVAVGPDRYCLPRHPTHSETLFLELNDIL